jgi:hypothetical protein
MLPDGHPVKVENDVSVGSMQMEEECWRTTAVKEDEFVTVDANTASKYEPGIMFNEPSIRNKLGADDTLLNDR